MFTPVTRRRFIEITPVMGIAGMTALAACSPKEKEAPAKPAPAAASPAPAPTPTPTPSAAPAASSLPMLDEKDPQAIALGYVSDASRTDPAKFNTYAPGNQCNNCANYLGSADDMAAECKIFPGKRVAAKGWCTAWVKRA